MRAAFFPCLILTLLLSAGLTAAYNHRADPYWLMQPVVPADGPDHRDLFFHLRLHKPYAMYYPEATALVLGSSTLGPLRPAALFGTAQSYNAALPGATLYEVRRMLEHAIDLAPVERVVLGLEYYQFRADKRPFMPGFADLRLQRPDASLLQELANRGQQFLDLWSALLSRNALAQALFKDPARPGSQRRYYYDGSWQSRVESLSPRGQFNLIAAQKYAEFSEFDKQLDFSQLDVLLELCESQGIEVTALLSPLHSYTLNAIDMAGGLDDWGEWLAATTRRLEQRGIEARVLAPKARLHNHAIDAEGGSFLDGVHYQRGAATRINRCLSAQLAGEHCQGPITIQSLSEEQVPEYLAALRRLVSNYRDSQRDDYRRLEKLIEGQRARQAAGVDIAARYR